MLKPRIMAAILVREGICVQSIGFGRVLPVGRADIVAENLDRWGVDEIALLCIDRDAAPDDAYFEAVERVAARCRVPLTVGGGLRTVEHVTRAVYCGADKVALNTALVDAPDVVREAARRFGEQCIVACVDARGGEAVVAGGARGTGATPLGMARRAVDLGAGEILLQSVDRDGSGRGYDLNLVETVAAAVPVPVIALGGAGRPEHLLAGIRAGASAVAAGNMFHYVEHAVTIAKRQVLDAGAPVRLDTRHDYAGREFLDDGRPAKRDEATLSGLRFVRIEEERI